MFAEFKTRANDPEIMDDFDLRGQELSDTLDILEHINDWLGGDAVLLSGMDKILQNMELPSNRSLTIMDVGCGSGDSLRAISNWNKKRQLSLDLIGVDANEFTIEIAQQKAADHDNIRFFTADVFGDDQLFEGVDIVVFGLFMHHFSDGNQLRILQRCFDAGIKAVLINDLHRHWLGYYLFHIVCAVFSVPFMVKYDGLLSVKKAFKYTDFYNLMKKGGYENFTLQWKWAFRYQLIIYQNK